MMNSYLLERVRRQELEREIEQHRLAAAFSRPRKSMLRSLVGGIGVVMVVAGSRLEAFGRYHRKPATV